MRVRVCVCVCVCVCVLLCMNASKPQLYIILCRKCSDFVCYGLRGTKQLTEGGLPPSRVLPADTRLALLVSVYPVKSRRPIQEEHIAVLNRLKA